MVTIYFIEGEHNPVFIQEPAQPRNGHILWQSSHDARLAAVHAR